MNIIDFLIQDHDRLRRELTEIHRNLFRRDLPARMKSFMANFEMHESIEDEILFPAMVRGGEPLQEMEDCEEAHSKIWSDLNGMLDFTNLKCPTRLQQAYFEFCARANRHFDHEERFLFPELRERLDPAALEKLGRKALERMSRFSSVPAVYERERRGAYCEAA